MWCPWRACALAGKRKLGENVVSGRPGNALRQCNEVEVMVASGTIARASLP